MRDPPKRTVSAHRMIAPRRPEQNRPNSDSRMSDIAKEECARTSRHTAAKGAPSLHHQTTGPVSEERRIQPATPEADTGPPFPQRPPRNRKSVLHEKLLLAALRSAATAKADLELQLKQFLALRLGLCCQFMLLPRSQIHRRRSMGCQHACPLALCRLG